MKTQRNNLTEPQIEFVKFLGNRNISNSDMKDIKRLISYYYVAKADTMMDKIWSEKGLSQEKMNAILNEVINH